MKIYFIIVLLTFLSCSVLAYDNDNVSTTVLLTGNIPTSTIEINEHNDSGDELIALSPNATTLVACWGVANDLDGLSDLSDVDAWLFDNVNASRNVTDNESIHYRNTTCDISNLQITGAWNCTFEVQYYALNSTWECSVNITDIDSQYYNDSINDTIVIEELLAIEIGNSTVDFGLRAIDVQYNADLPVLVYNEGNVGLDVQLDAWEANATSGDEVNSDFGFNCTIGQVPITGLVFSLDYDVVFGSATPMVASGPTATEEMNLSAQIGGSGSILPTNSSSYWGFYVVAGSAGICNGVIQYIAVRD